MDMTFGKGSMKKLRWTYDESANRYLCKDMPGYCFYSGERGVWLLLNPVTEEEDSREELVYQASSLAEVRRAAQVEYEWIISKKK